MCTYKFEYSQTILHLKCSDGEIFTISYRKVRFSDTILQLLEDIGGIKTYTNTIIPISLQSDIFKRVVEWLEKHETDVDSMDDGLDTPWDDIYIDVEKKHLFDLMMAANYLNIAKLLNLACKKVATLIKGKNPEEIRDLFNYEP